MAIPQRFRRLRSTIAEKLIPASYLESEKAMWEQHLFDALNGKFDDNEDAIADATEEMERYNKALAQRSGMNVYTVKFRYFNDPANKAKSVEGSMSVIEYSEEAAMANVEEDHVGLVVESVTLL